MINWGKHWFKMLLTWFSIFLQYLFSKKLSHMRGFENRKEWLIITCCIGWDKAWNPNPRASFESYLGVLCTEARAQKGAAASCIYLFSPRTFLWILWILSQIVWPTQISRVTGFNYLHLLTAKYSWWSRKKRAINNWVLVLCFQTQVSEAWDSCSWKTDSIFISLAWVWVCPLSLWPYHCSPWGSLWGHPVLWLLGKPGAGSSTWGRWKAATCGPVDTGFMNALKVRCDTLLIFQHFIEV